MTSRAKLPKNKPRPHFDASRALLDHGNRMRVRREMQRSRVPTWNFRRDGEHKGANIRGWVRVPYGSVQPLWHWTTMV